MTPDKAIKTAVVVRQVATAVFNKLEDRMAYLASRWADEKEHEDIAEYQKNIQAVIDAEATTKGHGIKVVKMLKRPFGFEYEIYGSRLRVTLSLRGAYGYRFLSLNPEYAQVFKSLAKTPAQPAGVA